MKLSVLQWNIWYKDDPVKIAKEIKKINPDIVYAQELIEYRNKGSIINTAKILAKQLGFNYYSHQAETWDNREDKESQGNAIYSKLPIKKSRFTYIQKPKHNPLDARHEGRVYVEIDVQVGDTILSLGTTHLSYSHKFKLNKLRKKEIDNLLAIIKKKKRNYIFAGDLNSTPQSYTIKKLESFENLKHAGPDYKENTWTTKPFNYHGFIENDLNWRLDYIFTTKDLNITKAKIIKTKLSDHLPIYLQIDI